MQSILAADCQTAWKLVNRFSGKSWKLLPRYVMYFKAKMHENRFRLGLYKNKFMEKRLTTKSDFLHKASNQYNKQVYVCLTTGSRPWQKFLYLKTFRMCWIASEAWILGLKSFRQHPIPRTSFTIDQSVVRNVVDLAVLITEATILRLLS